MPADVVPAAPEGLGGVAPVDRPQPAATPQPPALHGLAQLLTCVAVGTIAGLAAFGWAWLWLRQELADLAAALGVPTPEVPTEVAVNFAVVTGSLVVLAWLLGARTALSAARAAALVAGSVVAWTAVAYLLFVVDQYPAWPGFEGPFVASEKGILAFEVAPTWAAFAGPFAVLVLTTTAAWLGTRARRPTAAPPGNRWGTALAAMAVTLGVGLYTGLQVALWPSEVLGAWPANELVGWPFVSLGLATAVAWVTSGRGPWAVALSVLAAIGLLYYGSGTSDALITVFTIPVGVATVAIAAAHRPLARALARLVV